LPAAPFMSIAMPGSGRDLVLVVDRSGFPQDLQDLLLRGRLVDLLHRGEFAREAAGRRFEDLAFRIALLGLVVGPEQSASRNVLSLDSLRMPTLSALLVGTRSVMRSFSKRST
jgi:hypothetical protein